MTNSFNAFIIDKFNEKQRMVATFAGISVIYDNEKLEDNTLK